ncbi:hypothetical protein LEP1GSC172_2757 [Leptospira noguchii]|uniref:Uncharacterized protein n=2 Tax=Leptospira noguchii TaxID=28182 RepID=T0FT96_9LEPT|nr:hypothetical protein LEP1GSC172_2757 [Leptospira noguchii]EQA73474.1 hypothetical protein LEP1GSC059_0440 [Leptospira noguchii serovar Panama str. CZ214]
MERYALFLDGKIFGFKKNRKEKKIVEILTSFFQEFYFQYSSYP